MEHAGNCSVSCICQCSTVILLNKTFLHTNIIISLLPFYKVCYKNWVGIFEISIFKLHSTTYAALMQEARTN